MQVPRTTALQNSGFRFVLAHSDSLRYPMCSRLFLPLLDILLVISVVGNRDGHGYNFTAVLHLVRPVRGYLMPSSLVRSRYPGTPRSSRPFPNAFAVMVPAHAHTLPSRPEPMQMPFSIPVLVHAHTYISVLALANASSHCQSHLIVPTATAHRQPLDTHTFCPRPLPRAWTRPTVEADGAPLDGSGVLIQPAAE